MFNHVMVGVSDLEASKKFYDAVLATLLARRITPEAATRPKQ